MRATAILIFVLFELFSFSAQADTFYIPDTTLAMGQTYQIPVYGVVSKTGIIELTLSYSAIDFDIKDVICGDSTAISQIDLKDIDINDFKNSTVHIIGKTTNIESKVMCYLLVEPLVSPHKSSQIESSSMLLSGEVPARFKAWKAIITLEGPYIPKNETYLSQARPNPFRESLEFNIGLLEESKVAFYIYSASGDLIQKIPGDQNAFEYSINNTDGFSDKFATGNYTLKLVPNRNLVPLGLYVIFMDTGKKIYKSNFIFMK